MSRSNPVDEIKNPAVRFYEWSGSKGNLKFYDKELEENIEVELPFQFLVLDRLKTVKGWNDASESGIYSNEVRNTAKEQLTVKSFKGGEIAKGIYSEIRDKVKAQGARFHESIYIAVKIGDKMEIANLSLRGSALSAWSDFCKHNTVYEGAVKISSAKQEKKGATTFMVPVFEKIKVSPESDAKAKALDEGLQRYMKHYFSNKHEEETPTETFTEDGVKESDYLNDQLEMEKERIAKAKAQQEGEIVNAVPEDYDDSDLPF